MRSFPYVATRIIAVRPARPTPQAIEGALTILVDVAQEKHLPPGHTLARFAFQRRCLRHIVHAAELAAADGRSALRFDIVFSRFSSERSSLSVPCPTRRLPETPALRVCGKPRTRVICAVGQAIADRHRGRCIRNSACELTSRAQASNIRVRPSLLRCIKQHVIYRMHL